MYTSNEILEKVNKFIDQLTYDRRPTSLYEPIEYVLSIGGKRIRPVLMMLAYELWKENGKPVSWVTALQVRDKLDAGYRIF